MNWYIDFLCLRYVQLSLTEMYPHGVLACGSSVLHDDTLLIKTKPSIRMLFSTVLDSQRSQYWGNLNLYSTIYTNSTFFEVCLYSCENCCLWWTSLFLLSFAVCADDFDLWNFVHFSFMFMHFSMLLTWNVIMYFMIVQTDFPLHWAS